MSQDPKTGNGLPESELASSITIQLGHTPVAIGQQRIADSSSYNFIRGYTPPDSDNFPGAFPEDIAVVTLPSPFELSTQIFGLSAFASSSLLIGSRVTVAGYPLLVPGNIEDGHTMYEDSGRIDSIQESLVIYGTELDTEGGQSGSGIWGHNESTGAPLLYGIHSFGRGNLYNGGTAILWNDWDDITSILFNGPAALTENEVERLPISVLFGSSDNDILTGSKLFEYVRGEQGNDSIELGGGNDGFDGGAGSDTSILNRAVDQVRIFGNSDRALVLDLTDDSFDQLEDVEQLQLGAQVLALANGFGINQFQTNGALNGLGASDATIAKAIFGLHAGVRLTEASLVAAGGSASLYGGLDYGAQIKMGPGVLLSTGNGQPGTSSDVFDSVNLVLPGNAEIQAVIDAVFPDAGESHDANYLKYSFELDNVSFNSIKISIVFGSEEFPEFSSSEYVDIAAVIVNGTNYGVFNEDNSQPLSILDGNIDAGNFINNEETDSLPISYDGVSSVLSIVAPVQKGTNTILIGVADTGDHIYDSGIFVSEVDFLRANGNGLFVDITRTITRAIQNILNFFTEDSRLLAELGAGNDSILSGVNNDIVSGEEGQDTLKGGAGSDDIQGGTENDLIYGDYAPQDPAGRGTRLHLQNNALLELNDTITGGTGQDTLSGGDGSDSLFGDQGNDTIGGGNGDDLADGGLGNDRLSGNGFNDSLEGGAGNDTITGGGEIDTAVYATALSAVTVNLAIAASQDTKGAGLDRIRGVENIVGSEFDDTLKGNSFANLLVGAEGRDSVSGGGGKDRLNGGNGQDLLSGDGGSDRLIGGAAGDILNGATGNDRLDGGSGGDRLAGGEGRDAYVFQHLGSGADLIADFAASEDSIWLSRGSFGELALGPLPIDAFRIGAAAVDADDRVIYNSVTGELSFDPDGNNVEDLVVFAIVGAELDLTHQSFLVI